MITIYVKGVQGEMIIILLCMWSVLDSRLVLHKY